MVAGQEEEQWEQEGEWLGLEEGEKQELEVVLGREEERWEERREQEVWELEEVLGWEEVQQELEVWELEEELGWEEVRQELEVQELEEELGREEGRWEQEEQAQVETGWPLRPSAREKAGRDPGAMVTIGTQAVEAWMMIEGLGQGRKIAT